MNDQPDASFHAPVPESPLLPDNPCEERVRKDRPLHLRLHAAVWLICLTLLGHMWVASQSPALVERDYTDGVWPPIGRALAAISGLFPFSLFEAVFCTLAVWLLAGVLTAAYHVVRRQRCLLNALGRGVEVGLTVALVLVTYFYAAWGLNYARADVATRLGWRDMPDEVNVEELAALCEELVDATNAAYIEAYGTNDLGHPSDPGPLGQVDEEIDRAYVTVDRALGLPASFAVSRGRAKPVLASRVMCYMLISGFYNPWTGEANYNRLSRPSKLPLVIAHEKAHQRGITSEDEANFFGYLACAYCDDPKVRYSGLLFAQQQLLFELVRADQERTKEILARRCPGIAHDINAEREFLEKYRGKVSKVSDAVNDAYLKANRVKGGKQSYRMSAKLLVLYARQYGAPGLLQPPVGEAKITPAL